MARIATMSYPARSKISIKMGQGIPPALLALLSGTAILGTIPIFVRLSELGPMATGFWRLGLALPLLWLWSVLANNETPKPHRPAKGNKYVWLIIAGVCLAGDLALFNQALEFTSVTNETLLINTFPVFVATGAWLLFGERITRGFVLGLLIALVGAVTLVGSTFSIGLENILGDGLALSAAVLTAGFTLGMKQIRSYFSVSVGLTGCSTVTSIVLLALSGLFGESLMPVGLSAWLPLLGLALISHIGGQSLITYSLAYLPASSASICYLMQPVVAAILAWIILQEPLGPWQAVGGAIVLGGIILAQRAGRSS